VRVVRRAAPYTKTRWRGAASKGAADFRVAVAADCRVLVAADFLAVVAVASEVAVAVVAGAEEVGNDNDDHTLCAAIHCHHFRSDDNVSRSAGRTEDCRDDRSNLRDG
jgi:hypothetical protein